MEDTAFGYNTASSYTKGVYPACDPRRIAAAARLTGHPAPDPNQPFAYADFGCGYGMTVLLLAAMFPRAQFFGIDLMAEHIETAKANAQTLGMKNVTFLNVSFAEVTDAMLPPLDFAVSHGVLSWIGPEVRGHLRRLVARHLKPEGVFQASYNLFAGWSPMQPFREILKKSVDLGVPDADAVRVLRAVAASHGKTAAGPPDEDQDEDQDGNLKLPSIMRGFMANDINYIRHEYLNAHWTCFTNQDLAAEMAGDGLQFAGPWLAGGSLVPVGERPLPIEDPLFWEDYFSLRQKSTFRTTMFVQGSAPLTGTATAVPQARGHMSLLPSSGVGQQSVLARHFTDGQPYGTATLAEFAGDLPDAQTRRGAINALMTGTTVFLNHGFEPHAGGGAFRLHGAGQECISVLKALQVTAPCLTAQAPGVLTLIPRRMWQVLTTCAGLPVEAFAATLDERFGDAATKIQPTERTVANWQDRWAPWLAGMGIITPI